eukprot:COSAG06_NODE_58042_length_278_cov_0.664804_1_plen_48_part_10
MSCNDSENSCWCASKSEKALKGVPPSSVAAVATIGSPVAVTSLRQTYL